MLSLTKKIQRQQNMGNQNKVKALEQQLNVSQPNAGGGSTSVTLTPGLSVNATGSFADQAAAAPTPTPAPTGPTPPSGQNISTLNPQQLSSYNPQSGQPDPRDSTYWANLAKILATSQQGYAGGQLEQSTADTAYGQQLTEAGEARRRGVRDLAESMIGSGLLRSGAHNRRQTEGTIDYTNQLAGWGQEKAGKDASRAAQQQAILSNLGIDELGLYADATQRYSDAQAQQAAQAQALQETAIAPIAPTSQTTSSGTAGWNSGGGSNKKKKK